MIIFRDFHSSTWTLGKIFFQKYHISFDKDKKTFGVYTIKDHIKIPYSIIIIIILSLTLLSVIILDYLRIKYITLL